MKKQNLLLTTLFILCMLGCTTGGKKDVAVPYNANVEAFTTGKISRFAPVYLVLAKDVDSTRMTAAVLKKYFKLTPETEGSFAFENNRIVVFRPAKEFKRNTEYRVKADLSGLFDVKPEDREFSFPFSTHGLAVRANLNSLDINKDNENGYDISITLHTPDREEQATLEPLLRFSEKAAPVWQHSPDGKKHKLLLSNIASGADGVRNLVLSVAPNKSGVKEKDLLSVPVPGMNEFEVYDVNYVTEPERYIEVVFTKRLDETRPVQGLAYIEGSSTDLANVSGNKIRLYPDANCGPIVNVVLSSTIRSKSGLTLPETVVREVALSGTTPSVRFIGDGVIIPQSEELIVPFEAVYLRGVIARVIRINEQNIGQFLQVNTLSDSYELVRVGRIVARKTIFLDEEGADLSRWNTFAIDLKELIQPEPGAIYRLELSYNRDLSAYPCEDNPPQLSKADLLARDEIEFREEADRFDSGWYSYFSEEFNWYDYNYEEAGNPCSNSYYFYTSRAGKNVLATNIGIIAKGGNGSEMTVMVNNLLNAQPQKGVEVTAYNFQSQLLSKGITNDKGIVTIRINDRTPHYLIATQGSQRAYLRVDPGTALSLSMFDTDGEVVQKGVKGFIYGERGVWRPGDTLHLGFMLNDRAKNLPPDHPVVMELRNPLGQVYLRKTQARGEMGLYTFSLPTDPDVPTGAWNATVHVGGTTFDKRIRVETIKPNRLKINFPMPEKPLLRGTTHAVDMHVEWLQGATARNLKYDIKGTFVSTPTSFKNYNNYVFDDPSKTFSTEESDLITGTTDGKGDAEVKLRFELGTSAPGMLLANLVTRVFEESGDFSIDGARLIYSPYERYVGLHSPQSDRKHLNTGQKHTYEVALVNFDGTPASDEELQVEVFKVYWYWWWSSDNSRLASHISDSYNKPMMLFPVRTDAAGKANFNLTFDDRDWGTYFVRVSDSRGKHSTGVVNYFDWPNLDGTRDAGGTKSPNALTFKADKDTYNVGDEMVVTFPSTATSRAIVTIENGTKVVSVNHYECDANETTIRLKVTEEMRPNSYIYITLLQPHGETKNDLPIRLYGVVPFMVTSPMSHLNPVLKAADELKPGKPYEITVSEKDGREMAYTLAIVDEGLLDLTRFATPDPWKTFNAREALGVYTWDIYNYVVGAYGGRIEQLFSIGGDDALNKGPKAIVNRFKPVVQFEGPFHLGKGEKKRHTYQMPNYNGRVRMMVVAGDGSAYGHTDKSVLVRKPVMLLGTIPRVIGVGEEMVVPATVFTTEKGVGNVKVTIECSPNMEIIGSPVGQLHFEEQTDKQATFRIRVKEKPGAGHIRLVATGKGEESVYETDIEIRSVRRPQMTITAATLESGKDWKETITLPGADGTNHLTMEVSDIPPLNLSMRLQYLLGYPYGCLEQITSKAFPQLYLKELASLTESQAASADVAVKEVISRVRSYQTAEGAFAYWPGGTSINSWTTAYVANFLVEAEGKGYLVPASLKQGVMNNLRLVSRKWQPVSASGSHNERSEELTQAYRLYVLALAGAAETGAMNRLKEHAPKSHAAVSLLASAYALAGWKDVATELTRKTSEKVTAYDEYDLTFGSDLRDQAIRLQTLSLIDKGQEAAELAKTVSAKLSSNDWLSTHATAFALMSLSNYLKKYTTAGEMSFTYTAAGKSGTVSTSKNIWSEDLMRNGGKTASVEMKNTGNATLFLRLIAEGIPEQGEETAYSNGLALVVSYLDATGKPVDIGSLEQGTNFTAVVTVRNPTSRGIRHVALTEIFPAGWEILNTRFLHDDAQQPDAGAVVNYQDIRDDRTISHIDFLPAGRQVTVRVNLCAVYPGRFYLPPVYCEAMYDKLTAANTEGRMVEVR